MHVYIIPGGSGVVRIRQLQMGCVCVPCLAHTVWCVSVLVVPFVARQDMKAQAHIVLSMHCPGNGCELSTWPLLGQHSWVLSNTGHLSNVECHIQCGTVPQYPAVGCRQGLL